MINKMVQSPKRLKKSESTIDEQLFQLRMKVGELSNKEISIQNEKNKLIKNIKKLMRQRTISNEKNGSDLVVVETKSVQHAINSVFSSSLSSSSSNVAFSAIIPVATSLNVHDNKYNNESKEMIESKLNNLPQKTCYSSEKSSQIIISENSLKYWKLSTQLNVDDALSESTIQSQIKSSCDYTEPQTQHSSSSSLLPGIVIRSSDRIKPNKQAHYIDSEIVDLDTVLPQKRRTDDNQDGETIDIQIINRSETLTNDDLKFLLNRLISTIKDFKNRYLFSSNEFSHVDNVKHQLMNITDHICVQINDIFKNCDIELQKLNDFSMVDEKNIESKESSLSVTTIPYDQPMDETKLDIKIENENNGYLSPIRDVDNSKNIIIVDLTESTIKLPKASGLDQDTNPVNFGSFELVTNCNRQRDDANDSDNKEIVNPSDKRNSPLGLQSHFDTSFASYRYTDPFQSSSQTKDHFDETIQLPSNIIEENSDLSTSILHKNNKNEQKPNISKNMTSSQSNSLQFVYEINDESDEEQEKEMTNHAQYCPDVNTRANGLIDEFVDIKHTIKNYLIQNSKMYEKILLFIPLELDEVQKYLRSLKIRMSKTKLLELLDHEGIFVSTGRTVKQKET
jgi:hypothetical protein